MLKPPLIQALVPQLRETGLTGEDLITTFISRRVSPLQRRVHKICHMSGNLDPTRTSTFELTKAAIRVRVKAIATVRMGEKWTWGLEPYSRSNPPPVVSNTLFLPTSPMPTSFPMSVYCFCLLMPTGLFVLIQRFSRQGIEDGSDPSATWGTDRTEADAQDPDDDDNVPIPLAVPSPVTGKTRASSLRDWSEDEDDDCQILEVQIGRASCRERVYVLV